MELILQPQHVNTVIPNKLQFWFGMVDGNCVSRIRVLLNYEEHHKQQIILYIKSNLRLYIKPKYKNPQNKSGKKNYSL